MPKERNVNKNNSMIQDSEGSIIGEWSRRTSKLGAGSSGVVKKLTDETSVVKVIPVMEGANFTKALADAKREAESLRKYYTHSSNPELAQKIRVESIQYASPMQKKNIIQTIGADVTVSMIGKIYFFQPLVKGDDVLNYQGKNNSILGNQSIPLIIAILRGLQNFQKTGLVHRDIKPNNIIYDPNQGAAHFIDMGCAVENNYSEDISLDNLQLNEVFMSPRIFKLLSQNTTCKIAFNQVHDLDSTILTILDIYFKNNPNLILFLSSYLKKTDESKLSAENFNRSSLNFIKIPNDDIIFVNHLFSIFKAGKLTDDDIRNIESLYQGPTHAETDNRRDSGNLTEVIHSNSAPPSLDSTVIVTVESIIPQHKNIADPDNTLPPSDDLNNNRVLTHSLLFIATHPYLTTAAIILAVASLYLCILGLSDIIYAQEIDMGGDENWHNFMTAYTAPQSTYGSLASSGIIGFSAGVILSSALVFQAKKVQSDAVTATASANSNKSAFIQNG